MKRLFTILAIQFCLIPMTFAQPIQVRDGLGTEVTISDSSRIVSIGGDITEILVALGAEEQMVARDDNSTYPPAATELPSVGYVRALSAEGILSMNPSLILLPVHAGPPPVMHQMKQMGIPMVFIKTGYGLESVTEKISLLAKTVSKSESGKRLVSVLKKQNESLLESQKTLSESPRILFLLNAQPGTLMAAGQKTAADAMIRLADGSNVFDDFDGYKQISTEAALEAKPDVILLPSHGVTMMGGIERFMAIPGMNETPAAKDERIFVMDSHYLLSFGPRFLQAAAELTSKIHPEYEIPNILINNEALRYE